MTKVYTLNKDDFSAAQLSEAAAILKQGGTVAFPTETVYGLGANALSEEAVKKIFLAKGRPSDNPLIVHIADLKVISSLVTDFPERAKKLAEQFWPGPLTMVLPASTNIPQAVTAGLSTVAIRIPDHPVALALILQAGIPVAAPSANTSGRPSPTTVEHVIEDLKDKIDAVIDGGECLVGVESTVIDLTTPIPAILRPGGVTLEMLQDVLGEVELDASLFSNSAPRSPGMKYTHYSPLGEVFLVTEHGKKLAENLDFLLNINTKHFLRTAFLISKETAYYLKKQPQFVYIFDDVEDAAHNIYRALRKCDEQDISTIYCETFSKEGVGLAVMNRLTKAAGGKII